MIAQVPKYPFDHLLERLKNTGHKLTQPRQALLSTMLTFSHPFTVEELESALETAQARVHRATIYRDLALFVEAGLLKELVFQGSIAHWYELDSPDHHHHFLCQQCSEIFDVQLHDVEASLERFTAEAAQAGFSVASHHLKLYGLCPTCSGTI